MFRLHLILSVSMRNCELPSLRCHSEQWSIRSIRLNKLGIKSIWFSEEKSSFQVRSARLRLATLPGASSYHGRVAWRELSRREILQAVAEYDWLGQDRFLEKYGFGPARSYRLGVDGKTHDSKARRG